MPVFPCIACCKEVTRRQQAVSCDWCKRWQHRICGTGISQTVYREAVKQGGLAFVCRPCIENEQLRSPVMEARVPIAHVDADESDMPMLEPSVPDAETVVGDVNSDMLEQSVPVTVTVDAGPLTEEAYFQVNRSEISDLEEEPRPVADSTALDVSRSEISFNVTDPASVVEQGDISQLQTEASFNISEREIDEVVPIVEQTLNLALTETVLEDGGVTWTILEGAGQRATKILVSSLGYAYGVKRENQSSTVWRCTSRSKAVKCPVTVRQMGDSFVQGKEHVHPSVPDRELKLQIYAKVKETARSAVFRPAMDIAEDALLETRGQDVVSLPKKALLKRVANRARANLRPEEPKTLDFEIDSGFIDSDNFLVADLKTDNQRHFVFATPFQLGILRNAKRWYIDGTFKVVGEPFRRQGQLFSIHAFVESQSGGTKQVPLAFALMSRRTRPDYVAVLRSLIDKMGGHSVVGIMADFEQAAWNAVREVFPGVELKGCAFHWRQAVWRHVQELGLAETYRRRTGLHQFVRMIFGLQFLPANHIRGAVEKLERLATTAPAQQLLQYLKGQWLSNSVFGVEDWCVHGQVIRTNNDLEGWHHRFNSKSHLSGIAFYRLVPMLRREAEVTQLAVETDDLGREGETKARRRETKLQRLWEDYHAGCVKTSAFLMKVSDLFKIRG